jgi:DNA-directed RNA polymerase I, II, and III subunit RPABC1
VWLQKYDSVYHASRKVEKLMRVQTMQELAGEYHLEAFKEPDLLVNITKHFLVPKHILLRPEEKAELILK